MTSWSSAPGPGGTSPRSAPPSSGSASRSSRSGTGAASASTSAASPPRRCCATPSWRTSSRSEAETFGIQVDGAVTLRLRRGVQAQPQGRRRPRQGRALPDEEERHHRVRRPRHLHRRRTPARWPAPAAAPRPSRSTTASSPPGATTRLLPGTSLTRARGDLRGADPQRRRCPRASSSPGAGAIGVEFAYVLHNYGVKVTIVEFLDRIVPLEDEEVSAELARRYRKLGIDVLTSTRVESIDDSGDKVRVTVSTDGRAAGPRGRQGAAGDRLPAPRRGLRPGEDRRAADRARRDRHRRPLPHQRAAHLRHRRRDREADARARGRGDGHRRRRDHRRRGDDGARLRDDPAGDVLPAADRQLRLDRGAGPRAGLRRARSPSSRSPPTARRTASATRPASSRSSATASTASCSAPT